MNSCISCHFINQFYFIFRNTQMTENACIRNVPSKIVSIFDSAKKNDTHVSIKQHEQKHAHDNEETFENRHHHCLH